MRMVRVSPWLALQLLKEGFDDEVDFFLSCTVIKGDAHTSTLTHKVTDQISVCVRA